MTFNAHYAATKIGVNDEWLTPPHIVEALGVFDLDPCSPINRPWDTALRHLTIEDDGLRQPWEGRVWLNPPYGKEAAKWLEKLADHGNGIALVFARTETRTFVEQIWKRADALLFLAGRVKFHRVDGSVGKQNSGAPSVLAAYGGQNVSSLANCNLPGAFTTMWNFHHTAQIGVGILGGLIYGGRPNATHKN